ncbi:hypothetical protein NBRC116597_16600 [Phaeobacter sp. NW0010-22]
MHTYGHIELKAKISNLMKEREMIEATTNPAAQRAFKRAHQERAVFVKTAWHWLFGSR